MVARVFDDILLKGIRSGEAPGRTTASREWYRQQAAKTRVSQNQLTGDTNRSLFATKIESAINGRIIRYSIKR